MERSDHTGGCPNIATPLVTTISVQKARVMIVTPWMKITHPLTAFCLAQLLDKRRMSSLMNYGDSFVAHSRNQCADVFLKSDMEWMFTVDSDMLIPFGNAEWYNAHLGAELPMPFAGFHAVDRLLSAGKSLIGGLYFGRSKFGKPMFAEGASNPTEATFARKAPMDIIKPCRWCATGALLVHRSVFLDIEKKYPRLGRGIDGKNGQWFSSSEHALFDCVDRTREMLSNGAMTGEKALKALSMLEAGASEARRNSSLGVGEDAQFCHRAKEAGHQPFIDMGLVLGHIGDNIWGPHNTFEKPK